MIVWLTKAQRPESIYINCHVHDEALQDCKEPDALAGLIKYPSGILVTMDTFRESVYGYDIRLEVRPFVSVFFKTNVTNVGKALFQKIVFEIFLFVAFLISN